MARSSSFLAVGLWFGAGCVAPQASNPRPLEPAPALVTLGVGTDWGAVLFPPDQKAAASVAASEPKQAPPPLQPPSVFGWSEHETSDESIEIEHADVASFCKAQVGCFEIALPVKFSPSATFSGLHAVRVSAGSYSYSTLLAHVPGGVAPLQVAYDVNDPDDPGCPSIVRKLGIERVSVESGLLVVVALGETTTWVQTEADDGADSARGVLLPVVSIAKADGKQLHLRHFQARGGLDLGSIMQPGPRWVPWHRLAWKHRTPFSVQADGTLKLLSNG